MKKKDWYLFAIILVLAVFAMWQWLAKETAIRDASNMVNQLNTAKGYTSQFQTISGIGLLKSTHQHADIKVYINGNAIDFSRDKYQLTTSFIHFEEGSGDVTHIHATGMTIAHLMRSVGFLFDGDCILFEGNQYCNNDQAKWNFYVNGRPEANFPNYKLNDLDKYLISYGDGNQENIQKQLASITNNAPKFSGKLSSMD